MGLVGRSAASPQLLHGHHQLDDVQPLQNVHDLGRRHANREVNDLGAGNVDVDQPASELNRIDGHGFFRHGLVDAVVGDEGIDKVEIFTTLAIEFHYAVVLDFDTGFWVVGAVHGDQAHFNPLFDESVFVDRTLSEYFEAFLSFCH